MGRLQPHSPASSYLFAQRGCGATQQSKDVPTNKTRQQLICKRDQSPTPQALTLVQGRKLKIYFP